MLSRWKRLGRRRRRLLLTVAGLVVFGLISGGLMWKTSRNAERPYRPGEEIQEITRKLEQGLPEDAPLPRFTDVTRAAGLGGFQTFRGERTSQLPEDMGGGAAWGDFDNDGDDDLFLVSVGGPLTASPQERARSILYENLGNGTFREYPGFPELRIVGMGAAWGDYNGDGRLDLVVTGYKTLRLFRNEGDRFVRDPAIPELPGFWSGATWGDFDNDGDLDLYVCGYVQYKEEVGSTRVSRQYGTAVPFTLNPASYPPERNLLFKNQGDGTFAEVAETLGVDNPQGRSLSALWHDFDDNGWLDLYVANDISDNAFFRNTGGAFEEISYSALVADYRGAMGLAAGDWDRDGDDDLFISHWVAQENALYNSLLMELRSQQGAADDVPSGLRFMDIASAVGLGQIALQRVGWGAAFVDLDSDGWLDLVVANGSTFETKETPKRLVPQTSFLFWNRRGEFFHDLAPLNEALATPHVSRGFAVADYDNDGDVDLLFVDLDGGARLFRNEMAQGNWVQVRLRNRLPKGGWGFGDGAQLIAQVGEVVLRRTVSSASYLSQDSRTIHFGLGSATEIETLEVRWRAGSRDVYHHLSAGAVWELREGDPVARRYQPGEAAPEAAGFSERERIQRFWTVQRAAMDAMKREGDLERAVRLFREALALNPTHEDSLYYLANCLEALGDTEKALRQLHRLMELNPQSHRAHKRWGVLRAMTATNREELDEAAVVLQRALEINPEETGVLLVLGEIALLEREWNTARQRFEWATRTNPKAVSGFYFLGYLAWKNGRKAASREYLQQALAARGEDWKPKGATAEGDVRQIMHSDPTPLTRFVDDWDGTLDPDVTFRRLDQFLTTHPYPGRLSAQRD